MNAGLQGHSQQASILMQALDTQPQTALVDLGYWDVDKANPEIDIKHRGKFMSLADKEKGHSNDDKRSSPSSAT